MMLMAVSVYAVKIAIPHLDGIQIVGIQSADLQTVNTNSYAMPSYDQLTGNPKYWTLTNGALVEKSAEEKAVMDLDASLRKVVDGRWVAKEAVVYTRTNIVVIPDVMYQVGTNYFNTMESIFGPGSAVDTNITEAYVGIALSLNGGVAAETALRLKTWSDLIAGFWGTTYTFPYNLGAWTNVYTDIVYE